MVPAPLDEKSAPAVPSEPLGVDGQPAFTIRDILCTCQREGRLEYLIDWEGYGPEEQCWGPSKDILDPMLIQDF